MKILMNGETQEVESQATIADLIQRFHIKLPHYAVAINRQIIPRSEHIKTVLKEGDEIELVQPVGGG